VVAEGALHMLPAYSSLTAPTKEMVSDELPVSPAPVSPAPVPAQRAATSMVTVAPYRYGNSTVDGAEATHAAPPPPPVVVAPPAPARRPRGTGLVITLAVLTTVAAVVAVGLATHVIRLPALGGGAPAAGPSAGASASPEPVVAPGAIVPAGWQTAVSDPLSSKNGKWSEEANAPNASWCRFENQRLTAGKTTSGTYRCQGPRDTYTDIAVEVETKLRTDGVCGGVWFRLSRSPATGQEAGYLLKVCPEGYTLALHGLPESNKITDVHTWTYKLPVAHPVRVGVVAKGSTVTVYRDGHELGSYSGAEFTGGRTAIGVVVPAAQDKAHEVSYGNVTFSKPA